MARVRRPPGPEDSSPRPAFAESRHGQCVLTLELSSGDARSGDRVAGSLRAEMLQDVGVSEVRVELVRIEKFGNVQRDHTVDSVVLEPEWSVPRPEPTASSAPMPAIVVLADQYL